MNTNPTTKPYPSRSRVCRYCHRTFVAQAKEVEDVRYTNSAGVRTHGRMAVVEQMPAYILRQVHERDCEARS